MKETDIKVAASHKGFTLVELLIVLAIIGVLSSFLFANFISARQRARDAQRKSDLRQIQAALELFRSDQGTYPDSSGGSNNLQTCGAGSTLTVGSSVYIKQIPCDPLGSGSTYNAGVYQYVSQSSNSTYYLVTCLENANDTSPGTTSSKPSGSGNCTNGIYLEVTNP